MLTMELKLEQGSEQWKKRRRSAIGGSDVAAVMGLSPWTSPYQLYRQKVLGEEVEINAAMMMGSMLEEQTRNRIAADWNVLSGEIRPAVFASPSYPWRLVSLDGFTEHFPGHRDKRVIVEIKNPMRMPPEGPIPEHYRLQIQYQLAVSASHIALYAVSSQTHIRYEWIRRDEELISRILTAVDQFWLEHVEKKIPPELTIKDSVEVKNPHAEKFTQEYLDIAHQIKELQTRQAELRNKILSFCSHEWTRIGNVNVKKQMRAGGIDKRKLKRDGIDLEKYRLESSPTWVIREESKV